MKPLTNILSLYCILLLNVTTTAQSGIHLQKRLQNIIVEPEKNSFTTTTRIEGICPAATKNHIGIYFGELQTLSNIKAEYRSKGKWKKINKKDLVTSSVLTSVFYAGIQKTILPFPKQQVPYSFRYQYDTETRDLLFLNLLDFTNAQHTDTFVYKIVLPLTHQLHFSINDSLQHNGLVQIDSFHRGTNRVYEFTAFSRKGISYPDDNLAWVRLLLTPKNQQPFDFLNDWYAQLVAPNAHLDKPTQQYIHELVSDMSSDRKRIEAVFDLIKNRISYIAIENGIGAVMPRNVNKVWHTQQGDCKDMSNLLCQSLRSLGYDAKLALSATIGHHFDLDFPSLASANHVICVVQLDGQWIYLDATERSGFFGYPSRQIQGKNIFIINRDSGQLQQVPLIHPSKNRVEHIIHLTKKENGLWGQAEYTYFGLSQIELRNAQKTTASDRLHTPLKNYLERGAANLFYKNVKLLLNDTTSLVKAELSSDRNFTTIRNKNYLSMAFLPHPHQQPDDGHKKTLRFYTTTDQRFVISLKLDGHIRMQPFDPISVKDHGISFQFSVIQTAPDIIEINYRYVNKLLQLSGNQLKAFRQINELINKTLQKSIIYESST